MKHTGIIQELHGHASGVRGTSNVVPARVGSATTVSRIHVVNCAGDVCPGEIVDVSGGRIGRVLTWNHAPVGILVEVHTRGEDGKGGVQDADILPVDVTDIALGV